MNLKLFSVLLILFAGACAGISAPTLSSPPAEPTTQPAAAPAPLAAGDLLHPSSASTNPRSPIDSVPPDEGEPAPTPVIDGPGGEVREGPALMTNIRIGTDQPYQKGILAAGESLYLDTTHILTHIPPRLNGVEFIRTVNQSEVESDSDLIRFTLMKAATVYVLYDSGSEATPDWLESDGWHLLPNLVLSNQTSHRIYQKSFPAGEVVLGDDSLTRAAGSTVRYHVAAGVETTTPSPASNSAIANSTESEIPINHTVLNAQMLDLYLTNDQFTRYVHPGDSFILVSGLNSGEIDSELLNSWAEKLKEKYPSAIILAATSGTDNVRFAVPHLDPNLFTGLMVLYGPRQENSPEFSWDIVETASSWRATANEIEDWGLKAWGNPPGLTLESLAYIGKWDYGVLASIMGGLNVQTQSSCGKGDLDRTLQHLMAQYRGTGATSDLFIQVTVGEDQTQGVSPEEAIHCAQLAWDIPEVKGVTLWWPYHSLSLAEEFLIQREKLFVEFVDSPAEDFPTPGPSLTPASTPVPTVAPDSENAQTDEQFYSSNGIAVDPMNGNVYIAYSSNHRIGVFNGSGVPVVQWGSQGEDKGQLDTPRGISIDTISGRVYVADSNNHRIQVFNLAGRFLQAWGSGGEGEGQFNEPSGIAVDTHSGNVYITDTGNNRVQLFTSNGEFITQWGRKGGGNGRFRNPMGIAFDQATGKVHVVDNGNHRVQVFYSSGQFHSKWGRKASNKGQLLSPTGILFHPGDRRIYVADTGNHRVQVFDTIGLPLFQWGGEGAGERELIQPTDIGLGALYEKVYIVDSANDRVKAFFEGGTFAFEWTK